MSHASPLRRRAFALSILSAVLLLSPGLTAGQSKLKSLFGGDKNPNYQTFKDPAGRFELEYPDKDWKILPLPAGGSSLAVIARKDGPTLFVDHQRLQGTPFTSGEIEAMPEMEVGIIKGQQPKAKDFKSDMLETKAGRGVLIRYSRPGTEPESVLQYSIPVGLDMYRISGIVPEKQSSKYESIIMHMIQSFKASADPSTAKN